MKAPHRSLGEGPSWLPGLNFQLNYIDRTGDDVFIVNRVHSPEGDFWSVFAKFTHTFELCG